MKNNIVDIVRTYDAILTRYISIFTRNKELGEVLSKQAFEFYNEKYNDTRPGNIRTTLKGICVHMIAEHLAKEFRAQLN